MNRERFEGNWKQFGGKVKDLIATRFSLTDNQRR
jgi:uncharacterized protein YjbJ (UPF0337 family)